MKNPEVSSLFEEEKNEQNHPQKTKKLFISSLPLIQKALKNKNIRKKTTRKQSLLVPKKKLSLNRKNQKPLTACKSSGIKTKKIIEQNNNKNYRSESPNSKVIPINLMKFNSYKNTIIIDSNGNNNLNDEQRYLISAYLLKNKKMKMKIKINKNISQYQSSRNNKKSKTVNGKNDLEVKNKLNRNKVLHYPKKSKTLCSEENKKLLDSVEDNIDEKIRNILYKNLIHTKKQSMMFVDTNISTEIKENNEYGSFLESSMEDDEFSKGLKENLRLI